MVDTLAGLTRISTRTWRPFPSSARYWLLMVAALDVLLVISSMVALNAALPDIALQTSATQTQLTWIVDGYTLVLACLLLPAGAIGDRYGRRGALLVGLAIFASRRSRRRSSTARSQIIVARAVAGIGAAFIMPATLSLLTAAFPKNERNKAVGIWAGVASSGAIVGFLGTGLAAAILFVAVDLLRVRRIAASACSSARARSRHRATKPPHRSTGSARCSSAAPSRFSCSASWKRRCAAGRTRSSGDAWRPASCSAVAFAVVELRRASAAGCAPVRQARLRHRSGRHHVPLLRQFRLLLRGNAVHAVDPGLQPADRRHSPSHRWRCRSWFSARRCTCILPKVGLRVAVALGLFLIGAGLFRMRFLDAGSTTSTWCGQC